MTPLITIGVTCYNAEETIARALDSACAQDWPETEIVVTDDCSTDGSAAILKAYAAKHANIRLAFLPENGGAGAARQKILEMAMGAYVAFFDDDDESLPERVRLQYETIRAFQEAHPGVPVACYASGTRVYPNGYRKELDAVGSRGIVPHGPDMAARILYFETNPGWFYGAGTPSCSLMAPKDDMIAAGGFDPAFRRIQDLDLAVRLALMGGHFIGTRERLFIQHATEAGDKSAERKRDAELMLVEKYKGFLDGRGMYLYAAMWQHIRYYHFSRRHGRMALKLLVLFLHHPIRTIRHFGESAFRRFFHERRISRVRDA